MRVLLTPVGSDGDIEPFFALAQRLLAAGHEPLLATSDRFARRAAALGLPFQRVGPTWDEDFVRRHFSEVMALRSPLRQLALITRTLAELQCDLVPELLALARSTDLLVYPPLAIAAVAAARKLGTPHVSVHLAPLHRAARYAPTGGAHGRLVNRALWSISAALLRRATDPALNRIVESAGLARWHDILLGSSHSDLLDLIAVSPKVLERDPLWGSATQLTGYWFVAEPSAPPDPELARWVEHERPVVIGFGSMMGLDARELTARIVAAVDGLNRRVVLLSGWAGLGAAALPARVRVAPFVPHSWLLPRAACVVHHGGAGTTAAALRAGVPQAIAWHLGDQPIWGRKVAELGVGPEPRSHHRADARWLRGAIDRMLSDGDMQARARELGGEIRREDGATAAVRAIEACLSGAAP
jgi:sterol 3beta-glucosyltransferase